MIAFLAALSLQAVDEAKVDAAIQKGVEYLRPQVPKLKVEEKKNKKGDEMGDRTRHELVLLTLLHAGVAVGDPDVQLLLKDMLERPLEATYCVSLQAMCLEEIDRVKYQWRIRQCAQFLIDNQCKTGQWSYGLPSVYVDDIPTENPRKEVRSGGGKTVDFGAPAVRAKPAVKNKVKVEKKKDGPDGGDNSNTQYAALGLRACHDSGVILPAEVVERAIGWWRKCQKTSDEGGVEAKPGAPAGPDTASGGTSIPAEPRGWCYGGHDDHKPYGSMTAGASGALAIWLYIKDNDGGKAQAWKKDVDVNEGLSWLVRHFSVEHNPGYHEHAKEADTQKQFYYYLYGLERAAMLYGTENLGPHLWYPLGAKFLVEAQKAGGAWGGEKAGSVVETCFAILFLKRATRPLVASEAAGPRK